MVLNLAPTIISGSLFLHFGALWYIKSLEVFRSVNINVTILSKPNNAEQQYLGFRGKIMTLTVIALIALPFFFKDASPTFHHFDLLITSEFKIIGFPLGICGLILCCKAQVTMENLWRVRIDERSMLGLISHGIFNFFRNPQNTGAFCSGSRSPDEQPYCTLFALDSCIFHSMEFPLKGDEECLGSLFCDKFTEHCQCITRYIPRFY